MKGMPIALHLLAYTSTPCFLFTGREGSPIICRWLEVTDADCKAETWRWWQRTDRRTQCASWALRGKRGAFITLQRISSRSGLTFLPQWCCICIFNVALLHRVYRVGGPEVGRRKHTFSSILLSTPKVTVVRHQKYRIGT